jgi:hypothetical protein
MVAKVAKTASKVAANNQFLAALRVLAFLEQMPLMFMYYWRHSIKSWKHFVFITCKMTAKIIASNMVGNKAYLVT